jgi:hypothetical protein
VESGKKLKMLEGIFQEDNRVAQISANNVSEMCYEETLVEGYCA